MIGLINIKRDKDDVIDKFIRLRRILYANLAPFPKSARIVRTKVRTKVRTIFLSEIIV